MYTFKTDDGKYKIADGNAQTVNSYNNDIEAERDMQRIEEIYNSASDEAEAQEKTGIEWE